MSERIINALVQLFTLIAQPRSANDAEARRKIIYNFLCEQLNADYAKDYLTKFDNYYNEQARRRNKSFTLFKRHAAISVKVLRLANEINRELSHYQKITIIINLFEFLNINNDITYIEQSLLNILASSFNIKQEEFDLIHDFIIEDASVTDGVIFTQSKSNDICTPPRIHWEDLTVDLHFVHISSANAFIFKAKGSTELYLNGQAILENKTYLMRSGSSIRNKIISPLFYSDVVNFVVNSQFYTPITLEMRNVTYQFKNKPIGIQPISFESHSGKLVGIMGVSGSGKSTLTNVLSGMAKPLEGNVYINNIDIYKYPEKIKGLIGYVSQDDILIDDLTVYQNLYYSAKLSFDDLSEAEIDIKVSKMLRSLGLFGVKDLKVGSPLNKKISGGQRKRLNIALELIREPSILILDEPTSGLSSHDSENIVAMLKELSLKGKLIFIVIHQPSSDIFKMFDQLLILDTGGYLIYCGNPVESLGYFKSNLKMANSDDNECRACGNINVEQVLNIISMPLIDEYGNYMETRKVSPKEWYDKFNWGHIDLQYIGDPEPLPSILFKKPNRLKQLLIYFKRDVMSKISNVQYIVINILEAPILAVLLASLLRYYSVDDANGYTFLNNPNTPVYMIIAVVIAFFIGLTVSAEEIINDRKILKRESFLDLSRLSYLSSKAIFTMLLSAIQMVIFVLIGNSILGIKNMIFEYWMVLFATATSANMLGLILSDSLKKSVNIYIIIPFLVIPQLIFSGVFVSYDKMNPNLSSSHSVPFYGQAIAARWAFEALITNQFLFNSYSLEFYQFEKAKSQTIFYKDYWVPTMQKHLEKVRKLGQAGKQNSKEYKNSFELIHNEIRKAANVFRGIKNPSEDLLCTTMFNVVSYEAIAEFLKEVKRLNINRFNRIDEMENNRKLELSGSDPKFIERLRNEHYNYAVEQLVKNRSSITSPVLIEVNNEIIEKADPIFQDPDCALGAKLYSPYKRLAFLDKNIDTPIFNVIVLWIMNLLLFVLLYSGILSRFLNSSKISQWMSVFKMRHTN